MINVTASQLIAQAETLESLNTNFKQSVENLDATENALRGMWEGEANNAFHTAFQNDKTKMNNFYNAIEVYVMRLREIAARYQQAEATNTEIATNRTY